MGFFSNLFGKGKENVDAESVGAAFAKLPEDQKQIVTEVVSTYSKPADPVAQPTKESEPVESKEEDKGQVEPESTEVAKTVVDDTTNNQQNNGEEEKSEEEKVEPTVEQGEEKKEETTPVVETKQGEPGVEQGGEAEKTTPAQPTEYVSKEVYDAMLARQEATEAELGQIKAQLANFLNPDREYSVKPEVGDEPARRNSYAELSKRYFGK